MTIDRRASKAFVSATGGYLLAFLAALAFLDAWRECLNYRQFSFGKPFLRQPELWWAIAAELVAVLFLLRFARARYANDEGRTKGFFIALFLANAVAFLVAIPLAHLIGALAV
jgi:hypothetical protein